VIHVRDGPAAFYSELKPDNILLPDSKNDVLLIDFEQFGNWETFIAPEIYHVHNISNLTKSEELPEALRKRYD